MIAMITAGVTIPVVAHEGHGKTESASLDPNAPKKVSPETAMAIGLKTAEVDFGQVEEVLRLTGTVRARPDRSYVVSPRTAGIVRSIGVQPGDVVMKGDALAEVESQELAKNLYDVRRLEAEYERLLADGKRTESLVRSLDIEVPAATTVAEIAEAEASRLAASGEAVSANLLAQRRSEAVKLRADAVLKALALDQAKADVQSLRSQAESTLRSVEALKGVLPPAQATGSTEVLADPARPGLVRFLSPIDGVVVMRAAIAGQGAEAGAKMLTIADVSSVQIEGEVPESLVNGLAAAGTPSVRVRRSGDDSLVSTGTVRFISPVIDASKRTAHVIIDSDNPGGVLRQGMFVELAVVLRQTDSAVVVPRSAVLADGPQHYVFVQDGEYFKLKDIATGTSDDRVVEVRMGLTPGDVVIVQGAFAVSQLRGIAGGTTPSPAAAPAQTAAEPSSPSGGTR
ncbi:MAG: efflux RND transporter periplasmic adaptor subunit [Planctomycetes bacterium]|nr:efflux RND transporter periplasmic adaptor subunit [Planctomycetota bacterium]